MGRVIEAFKQFFDGDGAPLVSGWLKFLETKTNNTLKDTFADSVLQIPNANPLQLDGEGRCPDVFGTGSYRVISYTADPQDEGNPGEMIQQKDPVTAQGSSSAAGGVGSFSTWDSSTTYALGDIVVSSGAYYRSLIVDNLNNNPAVEEFAWEKVEFLPYWNSAISYEPGYIVRDEKFIYVGLTSSNLNNVPATNPDNWLRFSPYLSESALKDDDYAVLITDRDTLFILQDTVIADKTFTLPDVSSDNAGFRVGFYNDSGSYDMIVEPQGTASVWVDSTNTIIVKKGSLIELRYNPDLDVWMPLHNSGSALGGQEIGTSTTPITQLYATAANIGTLTATVDIISPEANIDVLSSNTIYVDDLLSFEDPTQASFAWDGSKLELQNSGYFNVDCDQTITGRLTMATTNEIFLNSGKMQITSSGSTNQILANTDNLFLKANAGATLITNIGAFDITFATTNTTRWTIEAGGDLVSAATVDIGNVGNPVAEIHGTTLFADTLNVNTVQTVGASVLLFKTDSTSRWAVDATGKFLPLSAYDIGAVTNPVGELYSTGIYNQDISGETGTKRAVYIAPNGRMGYI